MEPCGADKEGKALKGERWHLWQFAVKEKMLFYSSCVVELSYVELCMEDSIHSSVESGGI